MRLDCYYSLQSMCHNRQCLLCLFRKEGGVGIIKTYLLKEYVTCVNMLTL